MKIAFFNCFPLSFGGGLASFYEEMSAGLNKRYPSVKSQCVSFDEPTAFLLQSIYSAYFFRNEITLKKSKIKNHTAHTLYQMGQLLNTFDVIYTKNDILELTILRLIRLTQQLPPIVVGFHTPMEYSKTPTIQSKLHNIIYNSPYYKGLLKHAVGFHVLNTFHEEKLRSLLPEIPILKMHNPTDAHLFRLPSVPNKIPATLRLLWVGRLTKDKGCDDLVRLVEDMRRRRIHWTIVGDGAMRDHIANLVKTFDNVTYFPVMDRSALAKEFRKHDVFISTSKWECLPYTIIEAQLSGLPVIAYDIPGCNDIVSDGKTGYLSLDYRDTEHKIQNIKLSKFDKKKIRQNVLKQFDSEKPYAALYQFLK